jgi:hypothetical protein
MRGPRTPRRASLGSPGSGVGSAPSILVSRSRTVGAQRIAICRMIGDGEKQWRRRYIGADRHYGWESRTESGCTGRDPWAAGGGAGARQSPHKSAGSQPVGMTDSAARQSRSRLSIGARARRGVGYSPLARSALTGHEARVREPSSSVPKYSELIWPTLEAIQGPSDIRPSRPHPECVGVAPAHRIG